MNRKLTTILAGLSTAAAFAVNSSDWLHGGSASAGKFCVSAVFIVLISLLVCAWRKHNTAMCLLTIASALIAIGAASGLLMTADILPVNSVLLPFTVFLVPFFGVTNFMTSTAAAMFLPTGGFGGVADCRGWKLDSQLEKRMILRCVGEQCSPLRLGNV